MSENYKIEFTPDSKSEHNGGAWKMAESIKGLGSRDTVQGHMTNH